MGIGCGRIAFQASLRFQVINNCFEPAIVLTGKFFNPDTKQDLNIIEGRLSRSLKHLNRSLYSISNHDKRKIQH